MKRQKKIPPYPQKNPELKFSLQQNWRNRMNSLQTKMSLGGANIFRVIKARFKWGEKDFPKNIRKPKQ